MEISSIYRAHSSEMSDADYQSLLTVIAWMDEVYDILWHNGVEACARFGSYFRESYGLNRSPRFTASCIIHGLVN
jgi:hypothetical protein